jgi:hypothetical protein
LRHRLWQKLLPAKVPRSDDIDFEKLSTVELSGGAIESIVTMAAERIAIRKNGMSFAVCCLVDCVLVKMILGFQQP